jgi:hypothetical protein
MPRRIPLAAEVESSPWDAFPIHEDLPGKASEGIAQITRPRGTTLLISHDLEIITFFSQPENRFDKILAVGTEKP